MQEMQNSRCNIFVGFQTFYLLIAIKNTDVVHPSRCADKHISVSAGGLPLKPNALTKTVFYVNQMQYFSGHASFTNCGDPTKHNKLVHSYPTISYNVFAW